jgi:hypothetical protein
VNIALLIAVAALPAGDGAAAAPGAVAAPACQSYARASAAAPEIVRTWLAHSRDDHVVVCIPPPGPGAEPVYSGESAVGKAGTVCSYTSHLLTRTGFGTTSRLQRFEATEAVAMSWVGDAACPPAHEAGASVHYTMTYDLSSATFESLLAFWGAATTSAAAFDHDLACCGVGAGGSDVAATAGGAAANTLRARLRAAIVGGRMRAAVVTRIVRVGARDLHRRYALFVADPDSQPAGTSVYVIYVTRFLRGPWHITGISDVAP